MKWIVKRYSSVLTYRRIGESKVFFEVQIFGIRAARIIYDEKLGAIYNERKYE